MLMNPGIRLISCQVDRGYDSHTPWKATMKVLNTINKIKRLTVGGKIDGNRIRIIIYHRYRHIDGFIRKIKVFISCNLNVQTHLSERHKLNKAQKCREGKFCCTHNIKDLGLALLLIRIQFSYLNLSLEMYEQWIS